MEAKTPADSASVLNHWTGPADANAVGNVHGGVILKLMDEAAGVASSRHSSSRVVTGGMDRVSFLSPVRIGELITISAVVTAAWRTSMEVAVEVQAETPREGDPHHTCAAYVTMVAVDEHGRPLGVPALRPQTPAEELLMREAELRRANRLAERTQIDQGRENGAPSA
jgi:acyl-CoA hydrolase